MTKEEIQTALRKLRRAQAKFGHDKTRAAKIRELEEMEAKS